MTGWIYSLVAHALRLAAWPVLWWLGRRTPAFRERWAERRARVPVPPSARGGIVLHAVSMGEVVAATPIAEALLAAGTGLPLVFTCTTPTASALIRQRFGGRVHHCYLPFDTPGAMHRFVSGHAPRLLVVMETELWPNLLQTAQRHGVAVVLAGGRLSDRSARRYGRWRALTRRLLCAIDLLLVQDEATRARFLALGAAPARTLVTGSPKFDQGPARGGAELQARFRRATAGRRVWLAASTHEGEEAIVLDALAALQVDHAALLLVLVPRHPQRFDDVAALLERRGLRWQRRTELGTDGTCRADTEVLLGDTMGELHAWFGAAEVTFVGGSLIPRGGHSPLEAMACGTPLASGPHVFNFGEIYARLRAADAMAAVDGAATLIAAMRHWLDDPAAAQACGARARDLFEQARGAGTRSVAATLALLGRLSPLRAGPAGEWIADGELAADANATWLDATHWPQAQAVQGSGRGQAWFVGGCGLDAVLRHYRRGGWMAPLLHDRYLRWPGVMPRAPSEFMLLRRLRAWGLAVPRPLAARAVPSGLVVRGDLLVQRIGAAEDLARRLQGAALAPAQWQAVGEAIGRLHACGVNHGDLNCRNLMLDAAGRAWIVDFDASRVDAGGDNGAADLQRLRRSLRKEGGRITPWHWDEARDWPLLERARADAIAAARHGTAAEWVLSTEGRATPER